MEDVRKSPSNGSGPDVTKPQSATTERHSRSDLSIAEGYADTSQHSQDSSHGSSDNKRKKSWISGKKTLRSANSRASLWSHRSVSFGNLEKGNEKESSGGRARSSTSRQSVLSTWSHAMTTRSMSLDELSISSRVGDFNLVKSDPGASFAKESCIRRGQKKIIAVARFLVDDKWFMFSTLIFTVYALVGDDIRLIFTSKPADSIFDVVVIVCLVVFSSEALLSCLGKDDYFLSFFFWLDAISTASLILDLSWVANSDWVAGSSDDDDQMSSLRGGKSARAGARAGRVVRVLRLVRILKLYKAYYETKKKRKKDQDQGAPGLDDDSDISDIEEQSVEVHLDPNQTRVGKKLSETTIRKVIVLVLTMLLVLPFLSPQDRVVASSAQFGADHVWRMFKSSVADRSSYDVYANELLDLIYYHNWFAISSKYCPSNKCANFYFARLFWFGMMGKNNAPNDVEQWARLAKLDASSVTAWEAADNHQYHAYNYGTMPQQVVKQLSADWAPGCNTKNQVRWGISLLDRVIDGVNSYAVQCPEDLRLGERLAVKPQVLSMTQLEHRTLCFYFDLRPYVRLAAGYNLIITGFICCVLMVASLNFSTDANRLILSPVEGMIKRVEKIRANPLVAMKMADEEVQLEEVQRAKLMKQRERTKALEVRADVGSVMRRIHGFVKELVKCQRKEAAEPMETIILEKTIIKLGALMALGFGEAGANIIGRNMRGSASAGANAWIPGVRVECIIGVARIREFTLVAEVLQEKTNTFVNQIAEIVHGVVAEYHGAPNKNNGDTFMIVWRTMTKEESKQNRFADLSVLAFTKIIGNIHRSWMLAEYRVHPGLQQRLGSDLRVQMSFSLHFGWAIEGAVGSDFKFEASYLSPNVSIAHSLEEATQTYGIPFIISQSIVEHCSENMANKCRLMDKVIVTGSQQSMQLFTLDTDYRSVPVGSRPKTTKTWNSRNRFKARQFIENQKLHKMDENTEIGLLFEEDSIIKKMRNSYTEEFFQLFNMGYLNYVAGEWAVARRLLCKSESMLGWPDGPSVALLNFMENCTENPFHPPRDWRGVRKLQFRP